MSKTKEVKRIEAETRVLESRYVAVEKPCCKCKMYSKPICKADGGFTARKGTCEGWKSL